MNIHWICCIENIFTVQDFWATCACLQKQFSRKIVTVLNIFLTIQDFRATLRLPWKTEFSRRFNALAKEVQNTFDAKHKKQPTHYKNTMRPQLAIRSNTEHICTTMFIRRRILRVHPFVTRIWQSNTDSIPGCFIRPKRTSTLGSLNEAYGAPSVKIFYLTDLAQKLLSLRIFSYLCTEIAISAPI